VLRSFDVSIGYDRIEWPGRLGDRPLDFLQSSDSDGTFYAFCMKRAPGTAVVLGDGMQRGHEASFAFGARVDAQVLASVPQAVAHGGPEKR
jgi:hypothetical protein